MRIRSWNYSSMEPLYRGPLGVVSKARCESKGGRFDAITALDERLDVDATLRALDARMVRVGGLRSPLLVRDKGLVEINGRIGLASVLVDGVPLRYIVGQEALAPRVACGLAAKVARALHTAYDRLPRRKRRAYGLVHGDLRPEDIIVGENGDIRVANVGWKASAEIEQPDPLRTLLARPTAWVAPEAVEGQPSHAADVYSLMAILSWMLTGKVPSYASTEASWHASVVEEVSGAVLAASGEVALGELVAWGMSLDPAARPRAEEVYGWLTKLTRTLPGAQWPAVVASRLGSAQAAAIEAVVGLDDDLEDPLAAPPPEGLDWAGDAEPSAVADPGEVAWDATVSGESRVLPRAHVASVIVDPRRRAVDLSGVLPRADSDTTEVDVDEIMTEAIDVPDLEFDDDSLDVLEAPESFQGLAEVSMEADADADFALELGEVESEELDVTDTGELDGFTLEADAFEDEDDEDMVIVTGDEAAEPASGGATIRLQVGGGRGKSSWGRDDLRDVELPEHLFREDDPDERAARGPREPRETPQRAVRITMPVHEDSLDVFAFEGSETDAIEATTGRIPVHLKPVDADDEAADLLELPPPIDDQTTQPEALVVPLTQAPRPAPPSYETPRPPREQGGNAFLWAVGLASALILTIMAANPLIQSWRNPVSSPPTEGARSAFYAQAEPVETVTATAADAAPDEELPATPGSRDDGVDQLEPEPVPEPPTASVPAPDPVPAPVPADTPKSEARPRTATPSTPPPAPEPPAASAPPAPAPSKKRTKPVEPAAPAPAPSPPPAAAPPPPPPPPPAAAPPAPPAAASEPAPTSTGASTASEAGRGTLVVQGDATTVRLVGPGGTFGAGSLPSGRYVVEAVFGPGTPIVSSGDVVVKEGETVTVQCSSAFMVCRVQ